MQVLIGEVFHLPTLKEQAKLRNWQLSNDVADVSHDVVIHYKPGLSFDALQQDIAEGAYNIVAVRPKRITAEALIAANTQQRIDAGTRTAHLIRGGAGIDSMPKDTASEYGVTVSNAPAENARATAEHTIMMMGCAIRNIVKAHNDFNASRFTEPADYEGYELHGKTLFVAGPGAIGKEVAQIAHYGFGMNIVFYHPKKDKQDLGLEAFPCEVTNNIQQALGQADVVTLHMPLTDVTHHVVSDEWFSMMKQGVVVVNCARPGLIDPAAAHNAWEKGVLSGLAIDGESDDITPFQVIEHAILNPHIADCTEEAMVNLTKAAMNIIDKLLQGKAINVVNHDVFSHPLCVVEDGGVYRASTL